MHLFLILTSLLLSLTYASPITPRTGAGGPIAKPIPSTCTISNPLHNATNWSHNSTTSTSSTSGQKPSLTFTSTHLIYEAYFDLPTPADELWTQCSQQCYGYGDEGDCKSAILAYEVPVPKGYYGAEGGELAIGCLMFDENLSPDDFEEAEEGQWVDERAGYIYCSAPR
jgi:hypothetical protein